MIEETLAIVTRIVSVALVTVTIILAIILFLNVADAEAQESQVIDWHFITGVADWLELAFGDGVPGLIDNAFGDDPYARRVARCESGFDPSATGRAGERGIFQLHPVHRNGIVAELGYTYDQMYQPGPNIRVAAELHKRSGWGPWSCFRIVG